jgi:hypothetical protein
MVKRTHLAVGHQTDYVEAPMSGTSALQTGSHIWNARLLMAETVHIASDLCTAAVPLVGYSRSVKRQRAFIQVLIRREGMAWGRYGSWGALQRPPNTL